MATEYKIVDKVDHGTAELLRDTDDAIIAVGETDIYRLEEQDPEGEDG